MKARNKVVRVNREFECPLCAVRQPAVIRTECRNCGVKLTLYAQVEWVPVIEETDNEWGNGDGDAGS